MIVLNFYTYITLVSALHLLLELWRVKYGHLADLEYSFLQLQG